MYDLKGLKFLKLKKNIYVIHSSFSFSVMLSVVILSVVMLNVVAPTKTNEIHFKLADWWSVNADDHISFIFITSKSRQSPPILILLFINSISHFFVKFFDKQIQERGEGARGRVTQRFLKRRALVCWWCFSTWPSNSSNTLPPSNSQERGKTAFWKDGWVRLRFQTWFQFYYVVQIFMCTYF